MSVDIGISYQTMATRINYNAPLKSVRTIRAVKIEQHDPAKVSGDVAPDPARLSDAGLMSTAGIAFAWENSPGHSKIVDQEKATAPKELKPPPQHTLAPPPSSKALVVNVPKPPPPAAGASAESITPYPRDDTASPYASGKVKSSHHQLPPKPSHPRVHSSPIPLFQQSVNKPPPKPRRTVLKSVLDSGHGTAPPRNGDVVVHAQQSSGQRRPPTGPQETSSAAQDRNRHSSLASTTVALPSDDRPSLAALNRGSQNYFAERLQETRDFYSSERSGSGGTAPPSAQATQPNTRPASEVGSHSDEDWDGDQTDLGENFSHMNMRDRDGRCQVSVLDGEQQLDSSRHTDPRVRDFIMERFLPAAKAMVTESSDVVDRRSSQESLSVSPPSGKGRASLPGRSRFALKGRFAEEDEVQEGDENDKLFKCKFPWQVSAIRTAGPQPIPPFEPRSAEESPSGCFDSRHGEACIQADSATPNVDKSRSFEERRLPPQSRRRTHSGSNIPSPPSHLTGSGEIESSRALSFSEESANGDFYEGEYSSRSNDTSERVDVGVRTHRLHEAATRREQDNRSSAPPTRRSPEISFSGNLGTLLGITRAPGNAAGASAIAQEAIPPSSILNHRRNRPKQAAASNSSSADGSSNSTTNPRFSGNVSDKGIPQSRPPTPNVGKQQGEPPGASGRSLESLNDEVWERTGSKSPGPESFDRREDLLINTHRRNLSDIASDELITPGWPLAKTYNAYARTPSSDSKDASSSSFSDHSLRSPSNNGSSTPQEKSSSEKYSPVSVLQPPLPKSPAESWLLKVRPPAPPLPPSGNTNWRGGNQGTTIKKSLEYSLTGDSMDEKWESPQFGETNWRGTNRSTKPQKTLEYSYTSDSMDVKWEVLVNSETVSLRNKLAQESPHSAKVGSHGGD